MPNIISHSDESPHRQNAVLTPDAVDQALADYRKRKTTEAALGPAVSLLLHMVFFLCAWLLWTPPAPSVTVAQIEITSTEEQPLEELEELEENEPPPPDENLREISDAPATHLTEIAADVNTDEISETVAMDTASVVAPAQDTDFTNVLNVQSYNTNFKISKLYAGRTSSAGRKALARKYGGKLAGGSESSVLKALKWLKDTQNADGSWVPYPAYSTYQPAITGLCLLAFLSHGEDTASKHFGQTVTKAMQYLVEQTVMRKACFTSSKDTIDPYVNGIVGYALAEAYGMTRLPILKEPMVLSLRRIIDGQQPSGGYDYCYKKDARWDLSVAAWQFQAIKAAFITDIQLDGINDAIRKAIYFIEKITFNPKTGKFGYSSPGKGTAGMQGAGTLCLQLLGAENSHAALAGVRHIYEKILNPQNPANTALTWNASQTLRGASGNSMYYWYYCTQAMFHAGGQEWKDWNDQFAPMLIKAQKSDGHWDPPGTPTYKNSLHEKWYTTALCCLSLQVYYRYLPTFKLNSEHTEPKQITELQKLDRELGF